MRTSNDIRYEQQGKHATKPDADNEAGDKPHFAVERLPVKAAVGNAHPAQLASSWLPHTVEDGQAGMGEQTFTPSDVIGTVWHCPVIKRPCDYTWRRKGGKGREGARSQLQAGETARRQS